VWWLVTPGNPLKDTRTLPPLDARMEAAAGVAAHPHITVTAIETVLGTRYTADLVRALRDKASGARFVWIMGSDNLAQFARWERWREIADLVPIAVVARPRTLAAALSAPAAQALASYRVDEADSLRLPDHPPPAWVFLSGPRIPASSTALRAPAAS
jgi:nicotinate-nucleotide adenylyltransferase